MNRRYADEHRLSEKSWQRLIETVKRRSNYICAYCGKFTTKGQVDHILPLSKGGTDAEYNLVWACPSCNQSKGDKTLKEWLEYLGRKEREETIEMIRDFLSIYGQIPERLLDLAWQYGEQDDFSFYPVMHYIRAMWYIVDVLSRKMLQMSGVPEELLIAIDAIDLAEYVKREAQASNRDPRKVISEMLPYFSDRSRFRCSADSYLLGLKFQKDWVGNPRQTAEEYLLEETQLEDNIKDEICEVVARCLVADEDNDPSEDRKDNRSNGQSLQPRLW